MIAEKRKLFFLLFKIGCGSEHTFQVESAKSDSMLGTLR